MQSVQAIQGQGSLSWALIGALSSDTGTARCSKPTIYPRPTGRRSCARHRSVGARREIVALVGATAWEVHADEVADGRSRPTPAIVVEARTWPGFRAIRVLRTASLRPPGRQIFGPDGPGEYRTGLVVTRKSQIPQQIFDLFPICGVRRSPQRQSLRRSAAAIGDHTRTGQRSGGAAAGRADEGIQPSIIGSGAAPPGNPNHQNICIVVCEQVLRFVLDVTDHILVMRADAIVMPTPAISRRAAIARFLAV